MSGINTCYTKTTSNNNNLQVEYLLYFLEKKNNNTNVYIKKFSIYSIL